MNTCYNPYSLEGKTILITGASSGIGRATAVECSKLGAKVVLNARNAERLAETLSLLEGEGHLIVAADVTDTEQLKNLVSQMPVLNGAVFCAGVASTAPVGFATRKKLDATFETNFFAQVELNRLLQKNKKYTRGTSIVLISSVAAKVTTIGNGIYGASKAALSQWCKYVAREWKEKGMRINTIEPGLIETPLIRGGAFDDDQLETNESNYLDHRFGRPEEIAYGAIYLLSDASAWVTGVDLPIEGGGHYLAD